MTRNPVARVVLLVFGPAVLVAVWWVTSANSTSLFYPPLRDVLTALREQWLFEQVPTDLLPSLSRFAVGYLLAAVVGIGIGVALGLTPWLRRATQPMTEFLRAIPPPLLLPFAIVVLGIGNTSKVVVIALGSVWPVLLNTVDGMRGVDPESIDMARSFGLSRWQRVGRVMLPAASPQIMVGLRTALSIAIILILMVISEMQASSNGLGYKVLEAQRSFDVAGMFAGIIVIGVVGVLLNVLFVAGERRLMAWHHGARGLDL